MPILAVALAIVNVPASASPPPDAPDCDPAPAGSYWAEPADGLPVHPRSDAYVASIGLDETVHADFGSGLWEGGPIGIPYTTVPPDQERVPVSFLYDDESDPGPYPIPDGAPIEGGADADGDRHILVLDRDRCILWELFDAHPRDEGGWDAGSGARFDLTTQELRPDTWTSADAAGLPILPLLVRYDEVASGSIDHAIRVTAPRTASAHLWPARHDAGSDDPDLPPMGLRLRLKADTDLSPLAPQARVVAEAMKRHGVVLADNGSAWFISGVPDDRWDNDDLHTLRGLTGADFEAVDASVLMEDPDSAWVAGSGPGQAGDDEPTDDEVAAARIWGGEGTGRLETAVALSQAGFAEGAATAVLARSDAFADALAAGPLAAASGGPLLLTPTDALAEATATELDRLGVDLVYLAGGTAALSAQVEDDVAALGITVRRLGGADRFATAAQLAHEAARLWSGSTDALADHVLLSLGIHADPDRAWPDALAAVPYAANGRLPLLLTRAEAVPGPTLHMLDELGADEVTILGGTGAVSEDVAEQLRGSARTVHRIGGASRYDTAGLLADAAVAAGADAGTVLIATGQAFPDALGAGPAIASLGGVLLLTARDAVPDATASRVSGAEVRVAGGAGAVSDATVRALLRRR